MRPALKITFLFAATWIVIKLFLWQLGLFQEEIMVTGLMNNLFLLLAISLGLYFEKKKAGFGVGSALSDVKNAMTSGAPYVLVISVFMFFYYRDINPNFLEHKVQERLDLAYSDLERDSYIDSLKIAQPDLKIYSKEELFSKAKEDTLNALSPRSIFVFSLLGLMLMALTYSLLITLIFRKVLLREYYP